MKMTSLKKNKDLCNFLKEAQILADISSIGEIANITDYFRENETAYIVMDWIDGVSLEEYLSTGVILNWEDTIRQFLPIFDSLSRIHKQGLIHRDIKPDNILITKNGKYVLIDFGSAFYYSGEETHSVYLTEGYAPKEQYLRKENLGPYTDIYALCGVIYRCITGETPEPSIQRVVLDELKSPSEIIDKLPKGLDSIIMKGLQVEPESRWQNAEEIQNALKELLPKIKPRKMVFYLLSGAIITCAVVVLIYILMHHSEIKMRKMINDGNTTTLQLSAPQEMTTDEFEEAIDIIKSRTDAFAGGKDYLLEVNTTNINITLLKDCFDNHDWSNEEILQTIFAFDGKWRIMNSNWTEYIELSPNNISNIELHYGNIPIVSTKGDPHYYTGETIDWSSDKKYYLELEFDSETASFLKEYLSQEGYVFFAWTTVDTSKLITGYEWLSKGDKKTALFPIGPAEDENVAKAMYQVLSAGSFNNFLDVTLFQDDIQWLTPDDGDKYMCSPGELQTQTVEVINNHYSSNAESIDLIKKQLECLQIPYCLGIQRVSNQDDDIHIKLPCDSINKVILTTVSGDDVTIRDRWNKTLFSKDSFEKIQISHAEKKAKIQIKLREDSIEISEQLSEGAFDNQYFLYVGNIRIGVLESLNPENAQVSFEILLSDSSTEVVDFDKMLTYLCNIATSDINLNGPGFINAIWRDRDGKLLSDSKLPEITDGIDLTRFSHLKSEAETLGGNAEYSIDEYGHESLDILFNHWTGASPIDALEMVEQLFESCDLKSNLCSDVSFKISSWYKGDPIEIVVPFAADPVRKSIICTGGTVRCKNEEALNMIKKYVDNSDILLSPNDEKTSADYFDALSVIDYSDCEWSYFKSFLYESE